MKKKATKSKSATKTAKKKPAKKSAKKTVRAKSKVAAKPKKKAKALAKPKTKAKGKGLSIAELFEMKKEREMETHPDAHVTEIPPHELHDKANLQDQPKAAKMPRGPGPGNRHH